MPQSSPPKLSWQKHVPFLLQIPLLLQSLGHVFPLHDEPVKPGTTVAAVGAIVKPLKEAGQAFTLGFVVAPEKKVLDAFTPVPSAKKNSGGVAL